MKRIPKQEYTAQFKDQAVALGKGGKTVPEVARALGLVEQTSDVYDAGIPGNRLGSRLRVTTAGGQL